MIYRIDVTALMLWPVWKPVRCLPWLTQFGDIAAKRSAIVTVAICDCFNLLQDAGTTYLPLYAMSLRIMGAKINK